MKFMLGTKVVETKVNGNTAKVTLEPAKGGKQTEVKLKNKS